MVCICEIHRALGGLMAAAILLSCGLAAADGGTVDLPTRELEPHFKRRGNTPMYTQAMLELGMRLGAASTDTLRGDAARAKKSLAAFREQYSKVAGLVPSWRSLFPTSVVDGLAAAAGVPDQGKRQEAVDRVNAVCTSCHVKYMFPVQAQYRWGRFADVDVPGKETDLSLHQIMLDLANGLGAMRSDVSAGDFDAAKTQYVVVRERFEMLEVACEHCHEVPREYFIDSRVKGRLLKLGGMLRKGSKRVTDYNALLNEINEMSCFPCHQVHMPAAYLQEYWRHRK